MADWGYTYLTNEEDLLWYDEGLRNGWQLPPPVGTLWRVWGIRHMRAFYIGWRAYHDFEEGQWRVLWQQEWVSYAVAKGWV